jgi:hypothetical protein
LSNTGPPLQTSLERRPFPVREDRRERPLAKPCRLRVERFPTPQGTQNSHSGQQSWPICLHAPVSALRIYRGGTAANRPSPVGRSQSSRGRTRAPGWPVLPASMIAVSALQALGSRRGYPGNRDEDNLRVRCHLPGSSCPAPGHGYCRVCCLGSSPWETRGGRLSRVRGDHRQVRCLFRFLLALLALLALASSPAAGAEPARFDVSYL